MAKTDKARLIYEYLAKYPDHGDLTVARAIYKSSPEWWSTLDACRSAVRYYRGHMGAKNRKKAKRAGSGEYMTKTTGDTTPWRMSIPEPLDHFGESDPITLRTRKALILSDVHAPYHDVAALSSAIEYGIKRGVTCVVLNGDFLDFFGVSRWDKDPRLRDLAREVEIGRALFKTIREAFPGVQIIFKKGNHEERWETYLANKAPELLGVDDFETDRIFRLSEHNIRIIGKRQHLCIGSLNILHGHEFGRSIFSPVNPARGLFNRAKTSAIIGHYHQTSEHIEKDMDDKMVSCFSTGCLCDMRPDYARYNKWNHGAAIVEMDDDDSHFRVHNFKIINGRIV